MGKNKLPEEWKEIELGNIFTFQNKTGRKAGEGIEQGTYKFFTSSSRQTKFINNFDFDGEYLIFSTGGQAGIHYCKGKFSASNDCFIVKIKDEISAKYVYYYFLANIYLLEKGFMGAGLKHISKKYIQQIGIKYPKDKETQQIIVSILEKAEKLKERRKKASKDANNIIQNFFYSMFGNPKKNDKKWELKKLVDILKESKNIVGGPFGSNLKVIDYKPSGIPIMRLQNIQKRKFIDKDIKFISEEKAKELNYHSFKSGDIILAKLGDQLGKSCIVPDKYEYGIVVGDVIRIRVPKGTCNKYYILNLLNSKYCENLLTCQIIGATRPRVNLNEIRNIPIPVPPIDLQNKFADYVERIERVIRYQKNSELEIYNIFKALMQRAFNGELITWA